MTDLNNNPKIIEALDQLASYAHPKNYLEYIARWRRNNTDGYRVVFVDAIDYEEKFIFENDDFIGGIEVRLRTLKQVLKDIHWKRMNEGEQGIVEASSTFDYCGKRLRMIFDFATQFPSMASVISDIKQHLIGFERDLEADMNLDVRFSEPESEQHDEVDPTHLVNHKEDSFNSRLVTSPSYKELQDYIYSCDDKFCSYDITNAKLLARAHFDFLNPKTDKKSRLSGEEFSDLLSALDTMLENQELVPEQLNFSKVSAKRRGVKEKILTATGNINHNLAEGDRLPWLICSIISLFRLKGKIANMNRKLLDNVDTLKKK